MDPHFEDQHSKELQFEEEELEGSTQRRCGPSIPSWKEQPCSFDSSGECMSDNSSAFSRHVAAEVRDYKNIPMVRDWLLIKEEDKEVFWNRIKDEYEKLCQKIEDAVQKWAPLDFFSDSGFCSHRQQEPSHYNQGDMGEQRDNFSWSAAFGHVARKKRPIHAHHYKAGIINALVRII